MVVTEEFRVAVVRLGKEEGRPFADYHCMHPGSYGQDSEDSLCYACCSNVQLFDWGPDGQNRGLSVPTGNPSPFHVPDDGYTCVHCCRRLCDYCVFQVAAPERMMHNYRFNAGFEGPVCNNCIMDPSTGLRGQIQGIWDSVAEVFVPLPPDYVVPRYIDMSV